MTAEPSRAHVPIPTVSAAALVYGGEPTLTDPAEEYHEASKLTASGGDPRVPGLRELEANLALRVSSARAVKRHPGTVAIELPPPTRSPLLELVRQRRSRRAFGSGGVSLVELAALLEVAYGVTESADDPPQSLRATPSGGALYPLDIYAVAERVDGLEPGTYHYDPSRARLEQLRAGSAAAELERCTAYPPLFGEAAAVLLVVASFWRTRFKYGLRGYRFALIEAGHLAQNVLLQATASGLAAVPVGGYFDARLDEFLGLDGVDESTVYALSLGRGE